MSSEHLSDPDACTAAEGSGWLKAPEDRGVPGEVTGVARLRLSTQDREEGERCSLGRRERPDSQGTESACEVPALVEPKFPESGWGLPLVCEDFTWLTSRS